MHKIYHHCDYCYIFFYAVRNKGSKLNMFTISSMFTRDGNGSIRVDMDQKWTGPYHPWPFWLDPDPIHG